MTPPSRDRRFGQRGSANVEQAGLLALIAALILASLALLGDRGAPEGSRALSQAISRKIACAPQMKAPCRSDPLTEAYGRSLAGAVRALAPAPVAMPGPAGTRLVGVDFRRCRQPSCASPAAGSGGRLTTSNRRTTAFVSARRSGIGTIIDYWIYRPSIGWEHQNRRVGPAEIAELAPTPLLESSNPRLVPLETLPGRNHFEFRGGEEPPWRWALIG